MKILNGVLCDDDGKPLLIEGKPVPVQEEVDRIVEERLSRERKQADGKIQKAIEEKERQLQTANAEQRSHLEEQIKALEAQLNDTTSVQAKKVSQIQQEADARLKAAMGEAERYKTQLRNLLVRQAVYSAAHPPEDARVKDNAPVFIDPEDLFLRLSQTIQWEPVVDSNGKPTGDEQFVFALQTTDEKTKTPIEKRCSASEAARIVASQYPHLIQASTRAGLPGGRSGQVYGYQQPRDLSKMSATEMFKQSVKTR